MNISKFWNWKIGLVALSLPLVMAATMQSPAPSDADTATDDSATAATPAKTDGELTVVNITNFDALTNAVVATNSTPAAPASINLYGATAEVVKLAQGGVDETVLLSYVTNSKARFALTSDQIIYLNDLGVSGTVVTAMMQHDAAMAPVPVAPPSVVSQPPPADSSLVPETPPGEGYYPPGVIPPLGVPSTSPMDYPVAGDYYGPYYEPTPVADESSLFYDSLLPYGSWLTIAGVGLCWQPTVYAHDHGWRPYGDRGRWLYTDTGWYWQSDYSWGWAPFHYGRWARHHDIGWVWVPDRVWGPAWVSWRDAGAYVGWAPLPPGSVFVPGSGFEFHHRHVPGNFDFGLESHSFTFVPVAQLSDYNPIRYGVTRTYGSSLFGRSVVINNRTGAKSGVTSPGIDPGAIVSFGGTPVRRAIIHDGPHDPRDHRPPMDRIEKQGDTLVVVRPPLPGVTVKPANGDTKFTPSGGNTVLLPKQNGATPTASTSPAPTATTGRGRTLLPTRATDTATTTPSAPPSQNNFPPRVHVNPPGAGNSDSTPANPYPSRLHVTPSRGDGTQTGNPASTAATPTPAQRDGSPSRVRVYMTHPEQPKIPIAPNGNILLPPNAPAQYSPPNSIADDDTLNQHNSRGQGDQNRAGTRPTRLDPGTSRVLTPRSDGISSSGGNFNTSSSGDSGRTLGNSRPGGGGGSDASSGNSGSSRSYLVPSRSFAVDSGGSSYTAPVTRSAPSQPQGGYLVPSSRSAPSYTPPPSAPSGGNSGGGQSGHSSSQSGSGNGGGGNGGGNGGGGRTR